MLRSALLVVLSILALGPVSAVAEASSQPSISSESASGITSRRAAVQAQINPGGLETTWEVWVQYANCQNTPPGAGACDSVTVGKRGEGTISAGSTDQTVGVTLTHLEPGYSYTYWFVARNAAGEIEGTGQSFTALPSPVIAGESASGATGNDAKLEAQINLEGQNVRYQFQLVKNTSEYASELECPEPGKSVCVGTHVAGVLPIGLVWGHLENPLAAQPVSLDLESAGVKLEPGTTYHYRVIAAPSVPSEDTIEWEGPPVYGADQTFTTASPPVIEHESISHLTSTDATLEAQIDTEGQETSYTFYLQEVPYACLEAKPPCLPPEPAPVALPAGNLLGSFVAQSISADLNSAGITLHPGERYRYWVTSTSTGGETRGEVQRFMVPEDGVQPLNRGVSADNTSSNSGSGFQTPNGSSGQPPGFAISQPLADLTLGKHLQRRHHRRRHHHGKHHSSRGAVHKHRRGKTARRSHKP
jgi:hypothetical protein